MKKRILSLCLVLAMVIGMLPMNVFAAEPATKNYLASQTSAITCDGKLDETGWLTYAAYTGGTFGAMWGAGNLYLGGTGSAPAVTVNGNAVATAAVTSGSTWELTVDLASVGVTVAAYEQTVPVTVGDWSGTVTFSATERRNEVTGFALTQNTAAGEALGTVAETDGALNYTRSFNPATGAANDHATSYIKPNAIKASVVDLNATNYTSVVEFDFVAEKMYATDDIGRKGVYPNFGWNLSVGLNNRGYAVSITLYKGELYLVTSVVHPSTGKATGQNAKLNKQLGDQFHVRLECTADHVLKLYVDDVFVKSFTNPVVGQSKDKGIHTCLYTKTTAVVKADGTNEQDVTVSNLCVGRVLARSNAGGNYFASYNAAVTVDGKLSEPAWLTYGQYLGGKFGAMWDIDNLYFGGTGAVPAVKVNGVAVTAAPVTSGSTWELKVPLADVGYTINDYNNQVNVAVADWSGTVTFSAATRNATPVPQTVKTVTSDSTYGAYYDAGTGTMRLTRDYLEGGTNTTTALVRGGYIGAENVANLRTTGTGVVEFDMLVKDMPSYGTAPSALQPLGEYIASYGININVYANVKGTGYHAAVLNMNGDLYMVVLTGKASAPVANVMALNKKLGEQFHVRFEYTPTGKLSVFVNDALLKSFSDTYASTGLSGKTGYIMLQSVTPKNQAVTATSGQIDAYISGLRVSAINSTALEGLTLPATTSSDMTLPESVNYDIFNAAHITWTALTPELISADGKVSRPIGAPKTATLVASLTANPSVTKTFEVVVEGYRFYIGSQGYPTLQAAVDAVKDGETIKIYGYDENGIYMSPIEENVTIVQKDGLSFTIDGMQTDGTTRAAFGGTITINGNRGNASIEGETLTIKNLNLDTHRVQDCITDVVGNAATYAHNITVENCHFYAMASAVNNVVGIRSKQGFNYTIKNCTANGMHSLVQADGGDGITVEDCVVENSKNGISLSSTKNALVKNCTVTATGADGYGIRFDGDGNKATIENVTVSAWVPVLVRNTTAAGYTLTVNGTNNLTVTGENNTNTKIMISAVDYDGEKDRVQPTVRAMVVLNDTGLTDADITAYATKIDNTYYTIKTEAALVSGGETVYYETLADAVAAADDGDTVKVLVDITVPAVITVDGKITIEADSPVTITTNGVEDAFTVTGELTLGANITVTSDYSILYANGGTINIDGAALNCTSATLAAGFAGNGGKINLISGTVNAEWTGLTASGADSEVNVKGGSLKTTKSNAVISKNGATATVSGGTVDAGDFAALWVKDSGKLTVTGGTVSGKNAISAEGGSATVTGGTFKGSLSANATGAIAVSGGSFDQAVAEKYCAEGYIPKDNGDGTYGVKPGKYVAQVGTVKYESLAEALAAVQAGDTLKLLSDLELDSQLVISGTPAFTLDGNDKTIKAVDYTTPKFGEYDWYMLNIQSDVTVKNLTLDGSGVPDSKKITGIQFYGCKGVLENVTVKNIDNYYPVHLNGAQVQIVGDLDLTGCEKDGYYVMVGMGYGEGHSAGTVCGLTVADGATISGAVCVAMDTSNAHGTMTVSGSVGIPVAGAEAEVNGVYYSALAAAVAAADDGDTVKVLVDITVPAVITVDGKITIEADSPVTITTNGVEDAFTVTGELTLGANITVTSDYSILYANGGTINIDGAALNCTSATLAAGFAGNGGKINLISGTVNAEWTGLTASGADSEVNVKGGSLKTTKSNAVISKNGATVTVSGGTVDAGDFAALWVKDSGKLTVTGGTVSGENAISAEGGSATVTGGTFKGSLSANATGAIAVSGGIFDAPVAEAYCAAGYIPKDNGDGTYGVKVGKYVARINEQGYETLAEAIAAAKDGDTVKLLTDTEISTTLMVSSNSAFDKINITIDGVDHTVKAVGTGWTENTWMVDIAWNVLLKNITIDGNNTGCRGVQFYTSESTLENVTIKNISVDKWGFTDYAIHANASELTVKGNLTLEGCKYGMLVIDLGSATGKTASVVTVADGAAVTGASMVLNHKDAAVVAPEDADFVGAAPISGYIMVYEDGTFKMAEVVAQIGETGYATLAAALAAADDGDTVKVLADITVPAAITVDKKITIAADSPVTITTGATDLFTVTGELTLGANITVNSTSSVLWAKGGKITVDGAILNGAAYTTAFADGEGAEIILKSGKITSADNCAVGAENGGLATLLGGTVSNNTTNPKAAAYALSGGKVVVDGAEVIAEGTGSAALVAGANGTVEVKSGKVTGAKGAILAHEAASAKATVTGGTVNGTIAAKSGASLAVSGGIFDAPVAEEYCAEGYMPADNGDGTYGVIKGALQNIQTGKVFGSFEEALAATAAGETLKLLKDVQTGTLVISKGIKLDLNGFNLTADYVVLFSGNHVIDSAVNKGLLKAPKGSVMLQQDNEQLPIWNETDGYIFVAVNLANEKMEMADDLVFKTLFKPSFGYASTAAGVKSIAKQYFAETGIADNGLQIVLRLSWDVAGSMVKYDFEYSEDLVKAVYGDPTSTTWFSLGVTSLASQSVEVQVVLISDTGVEMASQGFTYPAP